MNWTLYPETATSPAFYQAGSYRVLISGSGMGRRYIASFDQAARKSWRSGPFRFLSEAFAAAEVHRGQYQSIYRDCRK